MAELHIVDTGAELDAARDAGREGAAAGWLACSVAEDALTFSLVVRPAVGMQAFHAIPFVAAMGMMDALAGVGDDPGLGLSGKVGIQWPSDIVCGAPTFETPLASVAVNGGAGAAGMFAVVTVRVSRAELAGLGVTGIDGDLACRLADAVVARIDAWAVAANTPQGKFGPLAPVLAEYFDMVPLLGHQAVAVSPNGLPVAAGVFAGLDIWGRATIKTDAGEREFPPEAVKIRRI